MSEAEYPLTPAQAAAQARRDYPQLAAFTKPSVDSDEQQRLYEANREGLHLPLGARFWRQLPDHGALECPGCGLRIRSWDSSVGTWSCVGCSLVSWIPT